MKIRNIKDINSFFSTVEKCEGKIELVTSKGDKLNLKSKLCQLLAFADVFKNPEIGEIEIVAEKDEDLARLLEYLIRG